MPSKKQSRRSISVRRGTYQWLQGVGANLNTSISDFIEERIREYAEAHDMEPPPPARPGIHKPAPKLATKLVARARAEALGVVQPAAPAVREMPPAPAVNVVLPVREACAPSAARPAPPVTVAPPLPPDSSVRWMTAKELARVLGLPPRMVRRALAKLETQQRVIGDGDKYRATELAILDVRNGTIRPIDNASRVLYQLARSSSRRRRSCRSRPPSRSLRSWCRRWPIGRRRRVIARRPSLRRRRWLLQSRRARPREMRPRRRWRA